jgi:hypothetical protein
MIYIYIYIYIYICFYCSTGSYKFKVRVGSRLFLLFLRTFACFRLVVHTNKNILLAVFFKFQIDRVSRAKIEKVLL